ncbi:MAG: pitrilysin family protein [Pseudomonadota bacterium]
MKATITFILIFCLLSPPSFAADETVLDIQKVTSPNGIEAWLVEDHSLPIISLRFAFKGAGSVNLTTEQQGISQLLSNTMDEGAGDYTSQEFQKVLSDNSITLRFSSNRDNFGGNLKFLTREKEKAVKLLTLALNQPRFDEEPLERMKQANLTRIKSSQTDPEWIAARLYNDRAYENHPYALNSGGTLTTLPAITADNLREFKNAQLTKDRLMIGVSGDISAEQLGRLLDEIFGALPNTSPETNIKKTKITNKGNVYLHEKDIPQTILMISIDSIDETDSDFYALQILNHIFGASGFGSRLMEEAREKQGLTYGIYSGLTNHEYVDALTISTSTKNKTVAQMIQIITDEMNKVKSDITDKEINKAKDYIIGSMPLSLTNNSSIASILLSLQLSDKPIDYLDKYRTKLNEVTAEDVKRLAETLFTTENMLTIMVGQPQDIENTIEITEIPNVE